jgi:cell division protein FtsX
MHIMGSEKATIQEDSEFLTMGMIVGGLSFLLILSIAAAVMLFLQLQNLREDALFDEGAPDAELES